MRYLMIIALGFISSGCLLEVLTTTAIQGELAAQNATAGQQVLNSAKDTKGKTELDSAIQMYTFDKEHYPQTLNDLVPRYLPAVPLRGNGQPFGYDPATGKVSLRVETTPYGGASSSMTAADVQNLGLIRDAIYTYWQSTGYTPESLDRLVPLYMDSLPSMSSGGAFIYDKTTGEVTHPAEFSTPTAATSGGGAPRQQAQGIGEAHSQSQLEALSELGY